MGRGGRGRGANFLGDVRANFDITVQGKVHEAELLYPSLLAPALTGGEILR
jgi:hypothetical protein